jgi:glucose-1-phosphate adenylyltransferase
MDYRRLIEFHVSRGAKATVGAVEVELDAAHAFGNLVVDEEYRVTAFDEKPSDPVPVPGRDVALVNMGVYVFDAASLIEALESDQEQHSTHDFGRDVLPRMVEEGALYAYPFVDENRKSVSYWRDIGTLDAYYEASMDLVAVDPVFNLYDDLWPIRTYPRQLPPAKMVFADEWPGGRLGVALDSLVCGGVIISGGRVERSVLGPSVRVNSYARVQDSVLMDGVNIGRHARLRRTIVDKGVQIAPGCVIGFDLEAGARRFTVTDRGVVVIPGNTRVEPEGAPLPLETP